MKNKLYLVQNTVFLTCKWTPTGDPRMPLACMWKGSKTPQTIAIAPSSDEIGRVYLCA